VRCILCGFLEAIIPQCPGFKALVLGRYLSAILGVVRQISQLNNLAPQITFNVHTTEKVNYRLGMESTNKFIVAMDCEGREGADLEEAGTKNFTRMTIGGALPPRKQPYTSICEIILRYVSKLIYRHHSSHVSSKMRK
jgi:hypothetical protein